MLVCFAIVCVHMCAPPQRRQPPRSGPVPGIVNMRCGCVRAHAGGTHKCMDTHMKFTRGHTGRNQNRRKPLPGNCWVPILGRSEAAPHTASFVWYTTAHSRGGLPRTPKRQSGSTTGKRGNRKAPLATRTLYSPVGMGLAVQSEAYSKYRPLCAVRC